MYRSLSSCALIFVALLAGTMATGCSFFVPEQESLQDAVNGPPLLVIEKPHTGLLYTAVDDQDVTLPGLQLELLVRVHDFENGIGLEDIEVVAGESDMVHRVRVRDERDGRYARLPLLTVPVEEGGDTVHIGVRIPMVAQERAMDEYEYELAEILSQEDWVSFQANQGPASSAEFCEDPLMIEGDITIDADSDGFQVGEVDCFGIDGDLRIEGSHLSSVNHLGGLQFITGDLIIIANGDLRELSALRSIKEIGGHFRVEANQNLPTEGEILALRDHIGLSQIGGVVSITGNGPG